MTCTIGRGEERTDELYPDTKSKSIGGRLAHLCAFVFCKGGDPRTHAAPGFLLIFAGSHWHTRPGSHPQNPQIPSGIISWNPTFQKTKGGPPALGKTLIEKFEEFARKIDCVFVLLTPDDKVVSNGTNEEKRRSRQNVIFELCFFYASLERTSGRVIVLHKGEVELPSDLSGIVWIDISKGIEAAGEDIRKEVTGL